MRSALRVTSVVLALLVPGPAAGAARLLVTVGEMTPTTAVIWARGAEEGPVGVEIRPAGGDGLIEGTISAARTDDLTGKLTVKGLQPATRYTYTVRSAGETVRGGFVTAPRPDEPAKLVFLWSGDLGGGGFCRRQDTGYPIFRAMARRRPDFFLFVGDTIYADVRCGGPGIVPGADFAASSLGEFRRKHRYNREDDAVQEFFRTTGVFAIWDDHEVRNDFAGPHDPLMPVGRRAFLEYWPLRPPEDEPTRMYRKFRWGQLLEVFILDTRQYRSPNTEPDGPGKSMLGPAQRRWLVQNLVASSARWKIVVSSVPLSIPTGRAERRDSWSNASAAGTPQDGGTGFAIERDAILRQLRDQGVRNLIVLAADVHHAELIRHHPTPDFSFHEFVAGPLSASLGRPRALDAALGPRSLFAVGSTNNFGEIAIEATVLTVRIIDATGTVLHSHTIGPE